MIMNNYNKILSEFNKVWTFQHTAMSVVLYFTYIIMIIGLMLNLNYKL
jgi:hypothetical protein